MGEAAPKDNSMEEILASIRRIISSDDEAPATGRKAAEKDTGKTPPPASAESTAAASQDPPAEPQLPSQASQPAEAPVQTSFRPQASNSAPADVGAGTLAGLAQQLRGTKGLGSSADKPNAPAPETAATQADVIEADTMEDAQPDTAEADPVRSGNTGTDGTNADTKVPFGAGSASSAQNLADLAKSINEKIGAASRKSGGQSDAAAVAGNAEMQATEAVESSAGAGNEAADLADAPSAAAQAETVTTGTLADIAESVQTDLQASAAEDTIGNKKADADDVPASPVVGENETSAASKPVAGTDGPEAFREALVSPSTQQAVSGSMDRLKQVASDLTQAQVEATLRPLLKEWLDDNLPGLVERMVQQEIDRIASQSAGEDAEETPPEDSLPQSKSA